ncbi:MAG TPA: ImmA/IrrE family metallo-endopeptidase [Solirubrobacter sp.]|nr:ImmA/IrrE family metallo-endopeptidase [Solirubrobacter sp.]
MDTNRGAKRAREARAALGLDPGAPLECLLSVVEERFPVVVAALPDAVAGACCWSVLWVNGNQIARRQRFTLAHEFGHAWIGHDGALEPDTLETLYGRPTNPYEIQANAFAAEFLVPRAGIAERVRGEPTLEDVVRIGAEYGVSAPVVVIRLKQLRLASPERLARLSREIDERLHSQLFEHLGLSRVDDGLARIDALPYLSPQLSGTLLAAALHGDAAVSRELAGALGRLLS